MLERHRLREARKQFLLHLRAEVRTIGTLEIFVNQHADGTRRKAFDQRWLREHYRRKGGQDQQAHNRILHGFFVTETVEQHAGDLTAVFVGFFVDGATFGAGEAVAQTKYALD